MSLVIRVLVLACVMVACTPVAAREYEAHYQALWCGQMAGEAEVTMSDGTRADCITATEAVEVDFSHKWAESIGQALLYAELTGLEPAVLLIVNAHSASHLARWHNAADGLSIRLYTIEE